MVTVGATANDVPDPTEVLPHPPEYQFHVAPVPKDPPVTDKVVAPLGQVGLTVTDALAAPTDAVLVTFTVTDTQAVVLHGPSART